MPIICPHCKKPIRQTSLPRDLGLLLHYLLFRVPIQEPITPATVEAARKHCRMKPDRLAELRTQPYARFWTRMEDKRSRRLAWLKQTGEPPPDGWTPPLPHEPDHSTAVTAMKAYRKTSRS